MKMLITSNYATNASSNIAPNWQRDHNYFVPAATKPTVYQAMKNRFEAMWTNPAAFGTFTPLPPNAATLASPSSTSTGVSTTPRLVWNRAPFATNFDVYLGTSTSTMTRVANVPAVLTADPPSTYSWTAPPLQAGTTYFWRIVARTNATVRNASLVASSSTWSFTTGGTASQPPPSTGGTIPAPWQTQDVGSVGVAGSASYSTGTFTVRGAGADIWGTNDSFRFVQQPVSGDMQIVARVASLQNTDTWAKAGVMLRAGVAANAAHVMLDVTPGGTIEFMTRTSAGAAAAIKANAFHTAPVWLKLVKSGSTVTASISSNGSTWTSLGSTSVSLGSTFNAGMAVTSHNTAVLNTAVFDNANVSTAIGGPAAPPVVTASNIVIYAADVAAAARHGSWSLAPDSSSPGGQKLVTSDLGIANTAAPLAAPRDYVDVSFSAPAGTPYRIWLRMQALNNNKLNDAVWVQFSDALAGGSPIYQLNSTSGLLVNLATDANATSLSRWGWQNGAYWLSQPTTVTFANSGTHTLRIQIREDGVQLDQIVLSPTTYLNSAPGVPTNDTVVVPKP
jgi:hypothetical protein